MLTHILRGITSRPNDCSLRAPHGHTSYKAMQCFGLSLTPQNTLDFDINFSVGGGFVALNGHDDLKVLKPGEAYVYRWIVPGQVR